MAYATDPNQQQEDEELQGIGGGAPNLPGSAVGGGSGTTSGASTSKGNKGSGQFADLNNYLRVNAPQDFSGQLTGKVNQDIDQATGGLANTSNEFKARADAGTVKDTGNLIGQLDSSPQDINAGDYQKLTNATYGGPTTFSSASDLYNQTTGAASSAQNKSKALGTESGRFSLLNDYFGNPKYSQGQQSLDNLLVQNNPNFGAQSATTRQKASDLQQGVNTLGNDLSAYGTQAAGTTQATRNQAREALGIDDAGNLSGSGALGKINTDVANRVTDYQNQANNINAAKQSGDFSAIDPNISKLVGSYGPSYGTKAQDFISSVNAGDINATNVTSRDEADRLKALYGLANIESPMDQNAVGTYYDKPLYNFDQTGYTGKVDANQKQFNLDNDALVSQIATETQKLPFIQNIVQSNPSGMWGTTGLTNKQMLDQITSKISELQRQQGELYKNYGFSQSSPPPPSSFARFGPQTR